VQIFKRDFWGRRWYLFLPEISKTIESGKAADYEWQAVHDSPE
jgi:hypothetical protein